MAASVSTAWVRSTGYYIEEVPELPSVVGYKDEGYKSIRQGAFLFKKGKAWDDIKESVSFCQ